MTVCSDTVAPAEATAVSIYQAIALSAKLP